MTRIEIDENLIVVAAVEGYSGKHNISTTMAFDLFRENNVIELLRAQYEVLHTQSLIESVVFAENILARRR